MSGSDTLDTWNGTAQAARFLRIGQPAVQQAIYRGTLPAIRRGFYWFVHRDDLIEYDRRLSERERLSDRAHAWREQRKAAGEAARTPSE